MGEGQAQPGKKSSAPMIIAIGCCCLLALAVPAGFIGLGGLGAYGLMQAFARYEVEARAFMGAVEAGDFEGAYARFSPQLQAVQSLDELKRGAQANPDLFAVQAMTLNHLESRNGVTTVRGTVTSKSGTLRHCVFGFIEVTPGGPLKLIEYQLSDRPLPE